MDFYRDGIRLKIGDIMEKSNGDKFCVPNFQNNIYMAMDELDFSPKSYFTSCISLNGCDECNHVQSKNGKFFGYSSRHFYGIDINNFMQPIENMTINEYKSTRNYLDHWDYFLTITEWMVDNNIKFNYFQKVSHSMSEDVKRIPRPVMDYVYQHRNITIRHTETLLEESDVFAIYQQSIYSWAYYKVLGFGDFKEKNVIDNGVMVNREVHNCGENLYRTVNELNVVDNDKLRQDKNENLICNREAFTSKYDLKYKIMSVYRNYPSVGNLIVKWIRLNFYPINVIPWLHGDWIFLTTGFQNKKGDEDEFFKTIYFTTKLDEKKNFDRCTLLFYIYVCGLL